MADKIRSPFTNPHSGPTGKKGDTGGTFGQNEAPTVSKPAEYGPDDIPLKFYENSPGLKPGKKVKTNSPMSTMKGV